MVAHNAQSIFQGQKINIQRQGRVRGLEEKNPLGKTLKFRFVLSKQAPGQMPIS